MKITKEMARKLGILAKSGKESKYNNVKTFGPDVSDPSKLVKYDSKLEAERAQQLLDLQAHGLIKDLLRQVKCDIKINNVHICYYVADFVYRTIDNRHVVEDCKSEYTRRMRVYRLKKKLMQAVHGVEIEEIGAVKMSGRRGSGRRAGRR